VLGVLFFAGLGLSFVNVIMRFVLLQPIQWAEELLGHWLVWSVCVGSFLVTWERQHLSMDLLVNWMPVPIRRALLALGSLAVGGVAVLMTVESAAVLKMMAQFNQRTMAAGIPVAIPYSGIALGFALMALAVVAGWARHKP
jgi:TRAP-type C4-dicarboxylate transport system permease small subunit